MSHTPPNTQVSGPYWIQRSDGSGVPINGNRYATIDMGLVAAQALTAVEPLALLLMGTRIVIGFPAPTLVSVVRK